MLFFQNIRWNQQHAYAMDSRMQICHLRLLLTAREGNVFRCVCLPPSGIPASGGLPLVATTAKFGHFDIFYCIYFENKYYINNNH